MKLVKVGLRIYIAISTIIGFLVGWILLAHSGKPADNSAAAQTNNITFFSDTSNQSGQALAPIPSLDQLTAGATAVQAPQALPQLPSVGFSPRIRTHGS